MPIILTSQGEVLGKVLENMSHSRFLYFLSFFFFFLNLFTFTVVCGLSLAPKSRGCSPVAVCRLLTEAAFPVKYRLWSAGSVVVVQGLSCTGHVESARTRV